jgi:hypothetical protein
MALSNCNYLLIFQADNPGRTFGPAKRRLFRSEIRGNLGAAVGPAPSSAHHKIRSAIAAAHSPAATAAAPRAGKIIQYLFILLILASLVPPLFAVVAAAIAAIVAGREEVKAILGDAVHWFNYFIHVHLP